MELRNTLISSFGVELPPTAILDYPTIDALAGHIASLAAPTPLVSSGAFLLYPGAPPRLSVVKVAHTLAFGCGCNGELLPRHGADFRHPKTRAHAREIPCQAANMRLGSEGIFCQSQ